jgi:hypothetical protein
MSTGMLKAAGLTRAPEGSDDELQRADGDTRILTTAQSPSQRSAASFPVAGIGQRHHR